MLSDLEKVKRAAASIKLSGSAGTADGYRTGGNPFFGGLRGYGGGDRRLIMVEDGEHVVRKEATAALGHGFFQRYNSLNFLRSLPASLPADRLAARPWPRLRPPPALMLPSTIPVLPPDRPPRKWPMW
jgi:hypothetical protein